MHISRMCQAIHLQFFVTSYILTIICVSQVFSECTYRYGADSKAAGFLAQYMERLSETERDADGHSYHIGICGEAMPKAAANDPSLKDAGVVQTIYKEDGTISEQVVCGKVTSSEVYGGSGWIMLKYRDGKNYSEACGGAPRTATVMIFCSKNDAAISEKAKLLAEVKEDKASECGTYMLQVPSSAVCSTMDAPAPAGLSSGSIFLIIFGVVFGGYMLLGMCYRRLFLGAQGVEQLPHHEFWINFGNLQADGCNFICRSKGASNEYRGIEGETGGNMPTQPVPSAAGDYDKDDHLLPM